MSTASSNSPAARVRPAGSGQSAKGDVDALIRERIDEACSALWWAELIRAVLRMVIVAILAVLIWVAFDQWLYSAGTLMRLIAFVALAGWVGWTIVYRVVPILRSAVRPEYAARSLERDVPSLRQALTSYVTLRDDRTKGSLRSRVVHSIGAQAAGRLRTHDQLPEEATGTLRWWIAASAALALLVAYAVISPKNSFQSAGRLLAPFASIDPPRRVSIRDVTPGDTDAIAGRVVEVSAVIDGLREGEQALIRWEAEAAQHEASMDWDADHGRFQGQIALAHSVSESVPYFITAGDATAGPFQLKVQNVPVVALQSVHYQPPTYTGQQPHTVSNGAITAPDGTTVTIRATTNRAVTKAKIEFNPRPVGGSISPTAGARELQIDPSGTTLTVSFPVRSPRGRSAAVQLESYRVRVWDSAGQSNPDPIIYPIRVIADLPPEVSIVVPQTSPQEVPLDSQQTIEVHALDADYGLRRVELEIRNGRRLIAQPKLWSDPKGASGNQVSEFGFRPAELGLRVGDRVQVIAVATDNRYVADDPTVEPNVARTDPVELRIVEPPPSDSSSDTTDSASQQQESQDQEKEDSSGGSSEGEPSKQQSGGGGSGEGTESSESSEGGGPGGQGEKSDSDNQSDGQGEGDNSTGESSQQETPGNNDSSGGSNPGEGSTSQSPSENESASSDPPGGGESQAQQQEGTEGGSGQPESNNPGDQTTSSSGGSSTGESGSQNQDQSSEAPQHDGEAFERIKDHLEQKEKEKNQSGGSSSDTSQASGDDQQQNQSGEGARPQEDQSNEGARPQENQSSSGSKDASTSPQEKSGTGSGEESGSDSGSEANRDPRGDHQGDNKDPSSPDGNQQRGPAGESSDRGDSGESDSSQQNPGEPPSDSTGTGDQNDSRSGDEAEKNRSGAESESSDQASGADTQASQQSESESASEGDRGDEGAEGTESETESAGDQSSESDPSGAEGSGNRDRDASGDRGTPGDEARQPQDGSRQSDPTEGESSGDPSNTKPDSQSPSPEGDPSDSEDSQSSQNFNGSGAGGEGIAKPGDVDTPPDPVDLDYAKQATDMVLDYLDQTRDAPDRELLDKLNWTEEDLSRFRQRWQRVRQMEQAAGPDQNQDVEDALKSLGLRKPGRATTNTRESADSLRAVRDAGNRRPVPAAHRDAFDQFRRAIGRQEK